MSAASAGKIDPLLKLWPLLFASHDTMLRAVTRLTRSLAIATPSPIASSSRLLATQASPDSPAFSRVPSTPRIKTKSKNPYVVPFPTPREKVPRYSHKSSRVRGRTPTRVRKSLSATPLAKDADGVDVAGTYEPSAVGEVELMLPSVFVRLVRNTGGHADDPYTATFRTDLRLTKPDISNYLKNIYGLAITSIRTINYLSALKRSPIGGGYSRAGGTKNYKKVLVTLTEPFWYPEERGRAWCNDHFSRDKMEELRDTRMVRIGDGQKYGVSSNRYRGAGKPRKEIERLKEAQKKVSEEEGEGQSEEILAERGMSSMKRPQGTRMKKNVLRDMAEKRSEGKTKIETEMDRLREAGY
jgi:ribosomal protein L23